MKRSFLAIAALGCGSLFSNEARAQEVSLGLMTNQLSNGIAAMYHLPVTNRFSVGLGLRYQLNNLRLVPEGREGIYEQNGYATHFTQRIGLLIRPEYRLLRHKGFELAAMANILVADHGFRWKENQILLPDGVHQDEIQKDHSVSVEATVGLHLSYNVTSRWKVNATAGAGVVGFNTATKERMVHTGVVLQEGSKAHYNWDFVGISTLPMMNLSVSYRLGKR